MLQWYIYFSRASLVATYCFKSKAILKSQLPKVRVCLLSNSCWVISSKTENLLVIPITSIFPINPIEPINLITLINLVELVKLVGPMDLIKPVKLVDLINWFLIFEPKFLVRLALIKVCILAPGISFGGSFCCMSLITSSNECWIFSYFCGSTKLLFFKGYFSLNTTFLGT